MQQTLHSLYYWFSVLCRFNLHNTLCFSFLFCFCQSVHITSKIYHLFSSKFNVMWRSLRKFWIDDITFLAVKITRRHKNPKDVRSVYPPKSSFSLQFCDRIYTVTCAFGIHVTLYLQIIPIIHELAWGEYDTMKVIYWWAIYSGA